VKSEAEKKTASDFWLSSAPHPAAPTSKRESLRSSSSHCHRSFTDGQLEVRLICAS